MDKTAGYYYHVTRELRARYSQNDQRLVWLKELTLDRLKLSSENFRSYVLALGTALVSFMVAQLGKDVPPVPWPANVSAILAVLDVVVVLSLFLEYAQVHLSARINGLCEILREVGSKGGRG